MVINVSCNRAIKASWCIIAGRVQFDAVCTAYSGKIDVQWLEYLVGQAQTKTVGRETVDGKKPV